MIQKRAEEENQDEGEETGDQTHVDAGWLHCFLNSSFLGIEKQKKETKSWNQTENSMNCSKFQQLSFFLCLTKLVLCTRNLTCAAMFNTIVCINKQWPGKISLKG